MSQQITVVSQQSSIEGGKDLFQAGGKAPDRPVQGVLGIFKVSLFLS